MLHGLSLISERYDRVILISERSELELRGKGHAGIVLENGHGLRAAMSELGKVQVA